MNEEQEKPRSVAEVLGIEFGQVYTWEDSKGGGEKISWSIDAALRIIGDRPPCEFAALPPAAQRHALERNFYASELNEAYAMTTDLTKPIIAVVSPVEIVPGKVVLLIIDGWHRIKHSVAINNQGNLPVHVLTPYEERQCRIFKIQ